MNVTCNLRQLMRKWEVENRKDLTFGALAEKTGKGDRTLRRWANNEIRSYEGHVLVAICVFFGVGVEQVLLVSQNGDGA